MTLELRSRPVVDQQISLLKKQCQELRKKGVIPSLKVLLVGDNPASVLYTKNKKKFVEKLGGECEIYKLPSDVSETEFLKSVERFNKSDDVHGILIQLPLPKHLSHIDVTTLVDEHKDVDGFHPLNVFKLFKGHSESNILAPCTPKGIVTLCKHYGIELKGKRVAIIGRSLIVGKPLSLILTNHNATVTLCHSGTKDLKEITRSSDIIVTATGAPEFFNKSYLNESGNQVVIDVGISKNSEGKTVGDCDFNDMKDNVSAITPVPGGVGPMTILSLAQNLLQAAKKSLYP
ncbi:bifunctional 5,10-methylenetetrahydrofolate dehydrogenase/5,10-methenyltetrahydrofolate cyclohydrolase [Halobacteriovorax sp. GB3]|uniref:bifunctional 5,10-methylenetetrahydrofolate dehydrogenase/5,10-methenyltetrahydrofolate cyclohydrolase n=1 Tax=Halobacteriovorax sp. GB3 TaxID=2719615 RepID=UPI002362D0A3|nr:bifunctional 5,10-methylenetetrahydrofolate dehydrogenase/5,10-methenyltetrahydrofolate cyclohydrolase [Halobacteriovorax sp. GB3]MDD0854834.1 bifunctional 5,10-methylenetetrahydrofolate dehydrogenase/5,10-methenyltetrahydrofolate cyclohydrolase [Halobacteriovorax sp. GB3]